MIILYGSQTGNSIHISKLIQNTILYGYNEEKLYNRNKSMVKKEFFIDMDSFDFTKILEIEHIIFVCSTHGNGTEPFNMTNFWKILRNKNLPPNFLKHLKFAVFGLGDSAYESYNYCSKKLFNCLVKHGATPIIRKGSGDSQDPQGFMTDFKIWIKELYKLVKNHNLQDANVFSKIGTKYNATLVKKMFLTPENYEYPVMELEFSIPDLKDYSVGDCLAIYPENYNTQDFIEFNNCSSSNLSAIDFNSIPQIDFFLQLSYFVNDLPISVDIKNKILEIYDNYDLYYDYILLPKRTIFEVIKDFNIKLTPSFIEENIPLINPRYFTLTKKDTSFFITVSLVSYKTRMKEMRRGLCSEYLKTVLNIDKVGVVKNKLDMSNNKLLFICTGTGITLPRACINSYTGKEILILYGFRYKDKDLLYEDEFKNFKVLHAISREDKQYVQDIYKKAPLEDIDDWTVFVSGNSRLNNIIEKMFFEIYKRKIRFQTETW